MTVSITVEGPDSTIVIDQDYCLRKAAVLLVSADINLDRNANCKVTIQTSASISQAAQTQTALAQAFIALHDRLGAAGGFELC